MDIFVSILAVIVVLSLIYFILASLNIAAHAYIIKSGASYRKILGHTALIMAVVIILGLIFWSFIW
ncbi:hypothetical protein [Salicibibacter kimchii]|uniref:Uncharacterized protein n=1 Tax=Salicibibacter kimchii TaxID=2099786 RepID=A0A345C2W7_9BACI|nr:hypothetical protein [Salicibibacter kimchii]AXF57548.1 hypothetical protein DT065_17190 [Salicibibacter kimchii]